MFRLRHCILFLALSALPAGAQLTWQLAGGSSSWPADKRAAIIAAMNEAVGTYNANGYFQKSVTANYDADVPTANGNYNGWINFGGSIGTRVAMHEISHTLGVGQYGTWYTNQSGGNWTGTYAKNRIKLFQGPNATIGCDSMHFWDYGLNYDQEEATNTATVRARHCKMVSALRRDMGIVQDSDSDGIPDDWEMFHFGNTSRSDANDADGDGASNLAEYNADTDPANASFHWIGDTSTIWTNAANWNTLAAPSNGTYFARLNVNNGANNALVYDAARGTTIYNSPDRGLVIGSGSASGAMSVTGGSFSTAGAQSPDVIGNSGNTGSLTVNGGTFTSDELHLGVNGTGIGTFTIQSGNATVTSLVYRFGNGGTGTTHLNGGTLTTAGISRAIDAPDGTANFRFNGGTLKASASNAAFLEGLDITFVRTGGALIDTNGKNIAITQRLLNDTANPGGGLSKSGGGTLTLAGSNTFTGETSIDAGTLAITHANALGTAAAGTTVASGATLAMANNTITPAGESIAIAGSGEDSRGALQSQSGANTWSGAVSITTSGTRIGVQDSAALSITGNITEYAPNTAVVFRAGGTAGSHVTLSGAANSWSGATSVFSDSTSAGMVKLGRDNALPATLLQIAGNGIAGRLDLNGFDLIAAGLAHSSSGTSPIGAAVITNFAATPAVLTLDIPNNTTREFFGIIGNGTGGVQLVKRGNGSQILAETSTYTGGTTVEAGTLRQGIANAFGPATAPLTVTGGYVNLFGIGLGVGRLDGDGGVIYNNASSNEAVLTLGHGNANGGDFSGSLADRGTGTGTLAIEKTGTGNQTLSGNNTYSGATSINAGVLSAGSTGALGNTSGATTVTSGASLRLADGVTITGESVTLAGAGVGFNGALQAAENATANWAGPVVLGDATARLGAMPGGTLEVSGAISGYGIFQSLSIGAGSGGTATVMLSAPAGSNTYSGTTAITRGTLKLGAHHSLPATTVLDVDNANAAEDAIFDLNGRLQTVAALQRSNTGGNTGTAIVTNTAATHATLTVNQPATTTFSGSLAGNMSLVKSGSGTLTLSGTTHTHAGATTVTGGTLALTSPSLPATTPVIISSGAVLALDFSGTDTVGSLTLGGFPMPPGTYSASTSPGWITGGGNLLVTGSSGFAGWIDAFPGLTAAQKAPGADPDNDGDSNLAEFAMGGHPTERTSRAKIFQLTTDTADAGSAAELILTILVRRNAPAFTGSPAPSATSEGITWLVQGSTNLANFTSPVSPVGPPILPANAPSAGGTYEYRTFRLDASDGLTGNGFLRVRVTSP